VPCVVPYGLEPRGDRVDRWHQWRWALDPNPLGQSRDIRAGAAPSDAGRCLTLKQRHRLGELAGLRETGDLAHVDLRDAFMIVLS
jgi:hypothetical protein